MRGQTPTLHCDAEDGFCGTWDVDYYEATASSVNGVRITEKERAPGWTVTTEGHDHCPAHSPLPPVVSTPPTEGRSDERGRHE